VGRSELEAGHVYSPSISQRILGQTIGVHLQLMCLQVHLRVEYGKLLLQALSVRAQEVVFPKVHLKGIVVDVVLLLPAPIVSSIADVTALVLVPTMRVKLVVSVKSLATEATFRVSLEAALIDRSGVIVAKLLMLPQLGIGEQLVLVGEDFLVSGAEITRMYQLASNDTGISPGWEMQGHIPHCFVVRCLNMAMQIRPPQTGNVALAVGAVVLQQQPRIVEDACILKMYAEVVV
jgi:hypothetical protein